MKALFRKGPWEGFIGGVLTWNIRVYEREREDQEGERNKTSFGVGATIGGSYELTRHWGLEWNGLKYVFGGDTYPNKWYMKFAKGADVASHECFLPPKALATYFGWDLTQATYVSTRVHTEPQAFGKIMSTLQPRLAVGYHSVQSPENNAAITDGVRKTYQGPLALARDLMVINVTKDTILVRMAVVDEYVLPPDVTQRYKDAPRTDQKHPSKATMKGKWKGYTPPPMPKK